MKFISAPWHIFLNIISPLRRPSISAKCTKKGITVDYRAKNPEQVMQMAYILLGRIAKAHNVDIRCYMKKLLEVDTRHKAILKAQADPRSYKKKQARAKGIIK